VVQRRFQECWTCKRNTFDKRTSRCSGCEADAVGGERSTRYIDVTALDSASAGHSIPPASGFVVVDDEPVRVANSLTRRQLFATVLLGSALGTVMVLVAVNIVIALVSKWWQ